MSPNKQKLTTRERAEFKEMLLQRRSILAGDADHMQESALSKSVSAASGDLSTVPYHMADVGTDNFEQEFTLGLIENEDEELRHIDEALVRLETGNFGLCEVCTKSIPKSRLKIIPYAKLCIECKRGEETVRPG